MSWAEGRKEKIFKIFSDLQKNRVIVEGFADRSKANDARQKMSGVGIIKNIQPISVGV